MTFETQPQAQTSKPWKQKEDQYLIDNVSMPLKELAKKLKRTYAAVSMRRQKLREAGSFDDLPQDFTKDEYITALKAVRAPKPSVRVFKYKGKHTIKTKNKLSWFTRKFLGVEAA